MSPFLPSSAADSWILAGDIGSRVCAGCVWNNRRVQWMCIAVDGSGIGCKLIAIAVVLPIRRILSRNSHIPTIPPSPYARTEPTFNKWREWGSCNFISVWHSEWLSELSWGGVEKEGRPRVSCPGFTHEERIFSCSVQLFNVSRCSEAKMDLLC